MNKINYVKLSHREANRKIWDSLIEKYKFLKQKNILLGYLWLIVASIAFGFIAIFGWFSYIYLLPKDLRFTPHYMQIVIESNSMAIEQANQYLNSQLLEYKKCLSYGNISSNERNSINTTFELLYTKYKQIESVDQKHEILVSKLSAIKQCVTKTTIVISEMCNNVDNIASYTTKKQVQEESEKIQLENLRIQQEKRITTAYNREKGRNLTSFESTLSDKQLDILTDYCNKIPVSNRDIEKAELKNILLCTHKNPLQVKNNKFVATLFTNLSEEKLICKTWKSVATRYKCFVSPSNKPLNTNDLYMANLTSGLIEPKTFNLIEECMEKILELK